MITPSYKHTYVYHIPNVIDVYFNMAFTVKNRPYIVLKLLVNIGTR
jgi:hypothetical protein